MGYISYRSAEAIVADGVAWLDATIVNWWSHIDVHKLVMYSGNRCILGQIGIATGLYYEDSVSSSYSLMCKKFDIDYNKEAYELGFNTESHNNNAITEEWKKIVRERQEGINPCSEIPISGSDLVDLSVERDSNARMLLAIERTITKQREALEAMDIGDYVKGTMVNRLNYMLEDLKTLVDEEAAKEFRRNV